MGISFCARKLSSKLLAISLVLSGSAFLVFGQTVNRTAQKTPPPIPVPSPDSSAARTNVDETFELNIDERRYSQENFEAATAVETNNAPGNVHLQIGVALVSGRIDVSLRNVHGRVRFRGTLDRILEIINDRHATSPGALSAPAPLPSPQ
jgi:hypothetical protein